MASTPGRSISCGPSSSTSECVTEEVAEDDGDTESETESISTSCEGVKKPKKFRSDVWDFFTLLRCQVGRKCCVDCARMNILTLEQLAT